MKKKLFSILFALVLVLSLSLVTAVPVAAEDGPPDAVVFPFELGGKADGNYVAEWSTAKFNEGSSSVHLQTTGTVRAGDEARILIDLSDLPEGEELTLGDIESISWYEYLEAGYPPHLDIRVDIDGDGTAEDALVFEYAYNTEIHAAEGGPTYGAQTNGWYETFSDDGNGPAEIGDLANAWLASGPPGPLSDENFIYGTLADWKAGLVDSSIDASTVVLAFEIEVDNWIVQSEAYVDDITIKGVGKDPILLCGQIQDAIDSVGDNSFIFVMPGTYTEDVTVNMNLTLVGAQFGVDPRGERAGDESEIVGVVEVTSAATNVAFAGFKFTSPTRAFTPRGFNLRIESESSTISNNIFVAEENGGHIYSGYLDFEGITNATVIQNSFSGHLDLTQTPNVIRLGITGAGIVTVADNEMRDVGGGGGIGIMCGNADAIINITGNVIENTGNECIWVSNWLPPGYSTFATLSITSNDLSEATKNGIKFELPVVGTILISGNEFWDNPVQVLDLAEVLDIQAVLNTNIFDRAVTVDHASLLPTIWSFIQDGVDEATGGDTINVAAGTYNLTEPLVVPVAGVTLQGANAGVPGTGARGDESTIDATSSVGGAHEGGAVAITADGVKVDGFTVTGARWHAIWVSDSQGCTITNNILSNNGYRGVVIRGTSNGNTITNNAISHNAREGIYLYEDEGGNTIAGNVISDSGRPGIYVSWSDDNIIEYNDISYSGGFVDPSGRGISLHNSCRNTLTGNTLSNQSIGIYVVNDTGSAAHYNNIVDNTEYGVYNTGTGTFDATNNWWGHASGPADAARFTASGYEAYGDAVSANVDYEPWLLAKDGPTFDKTLALKDGWTLVSTNKAVDAIWPLDLEALKYAFDETSGRLAWADATAADLKPVDVLCIKTVGGGGVGIDYSASQPGVSGKDLLAGWNLISSGITPIEGKPSAYDILSPLPYAEIGGEQTVGLTTLVSQGSYNQFSDSIYQATLRTADWDALTKIALSPYDGYWIHMNAASSFGVLTD